MSQHSAPKHSTGTGTPRRRGFKPHLYTGHRCRWWSVVLADPQSHLVQQSHCEGERQFPTLQDRWSDKGIQLCVGQLRS